MPRDQMCSADDQDLDRYHYTILSTVEVFFSTIQTFFLNSFNTKIETYTHRGVLILWASASGGSTPDTNLIQNGWFGRLRIIDFAHLRTDKFCDQFRIGMLNHLLRTTHCWPKGIAFGTMN